MTNEQAVCVLVQPSVQGRKANFNPAHTRRAKPYLVQPGTTFSDEIHHPRITHVDRVIVHKFWPSDEQYALPGLLADETWNWPFDSIHGKRLPADLEQLLSELPEGYQRLMMGRDLVLMESETRTVVDVMRHALPALHEVC